MLRASKALLLAGASIATLAWSGAATADTDSAALRAAVKAGAIAAEMKFLAQIGDINGDTRSLGRRGYDMSAEYVVQAMRNAGYRVTRQPFTANLFEETATPILRRTRSSPTSYTVGTDFFTMEYSGAGSVTGPVVPATDIQLPPPATAGTAPGGCTAAAYPTPPSPNAIALVQRGTCAFFVKAELAQAAGYGALMVFNEGQPGRTDALGGTLGDVGIDIPVVGTTFALGEALVAQYRANQRPAVQIRIERTITPVPTENVLAESRGGDPNKVVIVGAHLDSVPEGPGINDNGSGTGALLAIAKAMTALKIAPRHKIRFAFWGAEEAGLFGSEYYVNQLTDAEYAKILLNLNFDMLGSPNYVRFVYDGDGSATPTAGPAGSDVIEQVFLGYFADQGLATRPTAFDGRSDYGPFILVGIPAGGLFSGAEGVKTAAEATAFGGKAGIAYDPCYHQACDDRDNYSLQSLEELGDAAAHAVLHFATTPDPLGSSARMAGARARGHGVELEYKANKLRK